jgi:hypothetical protein
MSKALIKFKVKSDREIEPKLLKGLQSSTRECKP